MNIFLTLEAGVALTCKERGPKWSGPGGNGA